MSAPRVEPPAREWKVGDAVALSGDHYRHVRGVIVRIDGMAFCLLWNEDRGEWYEPISPLPFALLRLWPLNTPTEQDDYARAMRLAPSEVIEARGGAENQEIMVTW